MKIKDKNFYFKSATELLQGTIPIVMAKGKKYKELMQELGFSFHYFSSIFKNQAGDIYYLCYDYGFHPFTQKGVERALIIQKQEYMKEPNLWK